MARNYEMAQSKQRAQSSNDAEQDNEERELGIRLGTIPHELALNITEALLPPPSIADVVSACCIEDHFVERDRMRRMIEQSNQLGVSLHEYRASVADEPMHPITFLWERPLSRWANPFGMCRTYISGGTYMRSSLLKRPSHMLMTGPPTSGLNLSDEGRACRFQGIRRLQLCIDNNLSLLSDYLLVEALRSSRHDKTSQLTQIDATLVLRKSDFFSIHFGRQQVPCAREQCSRHQYPRGLIEEYQRLCLLFSPGFPGHSAFPRFQTIKLNMIVIGQPQQFQVTWKFTPWTLRSEAPPTLEYLPAPQSCMRSSFRCEARIREADLPWSPKMSTILALMPTIVIGVICESLCYVALPMAQSGLISLSTELLSSMPYVIRLVASVFYLVGLEVASVNFLRSMLRRLLPEFVRSPTTARTKMTTGRSIATTPVASDEEIQGTKLITKIMNLRPRLSGIAKDELEHWCLKHASEFLLVFHLIGIMIRWRSFTLGAL